MNIFWFRRDLRLEDNTALYHALKSEEKVLPIFIFDQNILSQLPANDSRVTFINKILKEIQTELEKQGKSLGVFAGKPIDIISKLISENEIVKVFANHDYEPYAIQRDKEIGALLKKQKIEFITFKDQVLFEKNEIVKSDGNPYIVYTPYSKKWKEKFSNSVIEKYDSKSLLDNLAEHNYPFLNLSEIGFTKSDIEVEPYDISKNLISNYEKTRNFPAIDGTSKLGPHLRFGTVSIREIIKKASQIKNTTFLNELIWREFFMQILWNFPHTINTSFRKKYDEIPWINDEKMFEKWCNGNTGYPFVDAGMRQLNTTGCMHNRVRMVVASFLCKHLLIDWRWGESYFATKLLDYEQSSNVGNWQWAAGSGVDAAPYFRIFNPTEQQKKFDKDLIYIKKWVPEFGTNKYPEPIVDHKEARERCITTFKSALNN